MMTMMMMMIYEVSYVYVLQNLRRCVYCPLRTYCYPRFTSAFDLGIEGQGYSHLSAGG